MIFDLLLNVYFGCGLVLSTAGVVAVIRYRRDQRKTLPQKTGFFIGGGLIAGGIACLWTAFNDGDEFVEYVPIVQMRHGAFLELIDAPSLNTAEHRRNVQIALSGNGQPVFADGGKVMILRSLARDRDTLWNYTSRAIEHDDETNYVEFDAAGKPYVKSAFYTSLGNKRARFPLYYPYQIKLTAKNSDRGILSKYDYMQPNRDDDDMPCVNMVTDIVALAWNERHAVFKTQTPGKPCQWGILELKKNR